MDPLAAARPRILYLDHTGQLGGAELSLLELARRHARDGGEVVLFEEGPFLATLREAGVAARAIRVPPALMGVERQAPLAGLRAIPAVLAAAREVARLARRFDLLHCNSQKAFVVGALAARLAGRPVVWHLRDILSAAHFGALNRRVAVALARACAARVIANSRATAEAFVAAGGPAKRVTVVYNGIDPRPFDAVTPAQIAALRQEFGAGNGPVIGSCSRLAPWKGQHVLLQALALLRDELPQAIAVIAGTALFGEDDYEAELRSLAERLGIAGRVRFLGFRRDIPALMAACDVIAHTSVSPEPFGRVIVEGQLAGSPVIATAAGGAAELVDDGVTGLLVPPRDAAALARAIASLWRDRTLAERLAREGRAVARERFTVERYCAGVEQVVGDVLRRRAGDCAPAARTGLELAACRATAADGMCTGRAGTQREPVEPVHANRPRRRRHGSGVSP